MPCCKIPTWLLLVVVPVGRRRDHCHAAEPLRPQHGLLLLLLLLLLLSLLLLLLLLLMLQLLLQLLVVMLLLLFLLLLVLLPLDLHGGPQLDDGLGVAVAGRLGARSLHLQRLLQTPEVVALAPKCIAY